MISTWIQIDPDQKRYRFYQISLEPDLFAEWRVRHEWGSISSRKRQFQIKIFESEATALIHLHKQEQKRLRRGYTLVRE